MSDGDPIIELDRSFAPIVPELVVAHLDASIAFYTTHLGFEVAFASEPRQAAVLTLQGQQLVLTQAQPADPAGGTGLVHPALRGVTLLLRLADPKPAYEGLRAAFDATIVSPMEISTLIRGAERFERASFVVSDPDGYQVRVSD